MHIKKDPSSSLEVKKMLEEILLVIDSQLKQDFLKNKKSETKVGSIQIIYRAKTLKEHEVSLLERAANKRESGLVSLRKNMILEGSLALEEAKQIVEEKKICKEAELIVSTYQSAAESFLYLKKQDFDSSLKLMKMALEAHKDLFLTYGHPIEKRRIHLGCNIAKIFTLSQKPVSSFKLLTQLIEYIFVKEQNWSLDYCKVENPDKISFEEKMHVVNQLLGEMGKILGRNRNEEIFKSFDNLIDKLEQNKNLETMIILSWCKAFKAILKNNKIDFLKNTSCFLKEEKSVLPSAKNHLLTLLNTNFNLQDNRILNTN